MIVLNIFKTVKQVHLRMTNSSLITRLSSNADIAEQRLAELKKQFEELKTTKINKKIQELRDENSKLQAQVEVAKQELITLETLNGKKQIPLPAKKQISNIENAPQVEATKVEGKEMVENKQKEVTEKKPKEKKEKVLNVKTAPQVDEAPVDVGRLDFRIGKIVEVKRHPDADALYVEQVDCGEEKPRTVVSGLVNHVPIEEMKDRMVVLLCNLKPAKMRGVTSEAMVMCASTPEKVEILSPPEGSVPGDHVHCDGYTRHPDAILNPKKKIFETCAPDLKTNSNGIACFKGTPLMVPAKGDIKAKSLKNAPVK